MRSNHLGGLPRVFWVLWAGTLVSRMGTMVEPFLALYLTGVRHLSLMTVGAVLLTFGAGSFVSHLVGGWLADRIGRRATLSGGMMATAVALVAMGYVQSLPAIFVTVFAIGATMDMYRPASAAAVADVVPHADQPRAYGLLYWAINLGFAVATVVGGVFAHGAFLWLFWVNALTSAGFALLVWHALPETGAVARAKPPGQRAFGGSYSTVLRDRTFVGYTLVVLAFAAVYVQGITTLPLAMREDGLSPASYGLTIGVNGLTVLVVQPLVVGWLARRDLSRVVAVGMVLLGAGFGLTALAETVWQYIASVVVWTLGEITIMSVAQTIVASLASPALRGRYNGIHGIAWSTANLVAPFVGAVLLQEFGSTMLWLSCLGTGLAGACGQLMLRSAIRRRTEGAATAPSQ